MSAKLTHVYQRAATKNFESKILSNQNKITNFAVILQLLKDIGLSNNLQKFYFPYLDIIRKLGEKKNQIKIEIDKVEENVKTMETTIEGKKKHIEILRKIGEKLMEILGSNTIEFVNVGWSNIEINFLDMIYLKNNQNGNNLTGSKFILEYLLEKVEEQIKNKHQKGGVLSSTPELSIEGASEEETEINSLRKELQKSKNKNIETDLISTMKKCVDVFEMNYKNIQELFFEDKNNYIGIGVVDEKSCSKFKDYEQEKLILEGLIKGYSKNQDNNDIPQKTLNFFINILKYYANLLNMALYYAGDITNCGSIKDNFLDFTNVSQKILEKAQNDNYAEKVEKKKQELLKSSNEYKKAKNRFESQVEILKQKGILEDIFRPLLFYKKNKFKNIKISIFDIFLKKDIKTIIKCYDNILQNINDEINDKKKI